MRTKIGNIHHIAPWPREPKQLKRCCRDILRVSPLGIRGQAPISSHDAPLRCALFVHPASAAAALRDYTKLMDIAKQVLRILDEVLSLEGRAANFSRETLLLGAIPELDSMAVVSLITAFEEQLGITVDDDEIDGATFASVGSLTDFVAERLA